MGCAVGGCGERAGARIPPVLLLVRVMRGSGNGLEAAGQLEPDEHLGIPFEAAFPGRDSQRPVGQGLACSFRRAGDGNYYPGDLDA